MALRGKRPVVLVSMALLLMIVGLGMQGCSRNSAQPESQTKSETITREIESLSRSRSSKTLKPGDAAEEALTIKPTTETAGLYNAIKGADRVVISVVADIIDDREKETVLSSFNAQDPVFWDIMRAVTSANKQGSV